MNLDLFISKILRDLSIDISTVDTMIDESSIIVVLEREREKERKREREKERKRERKREREKERKREGEKERKRERE